MRGPSEILFLRGPSDIFHIYLKKEIKDPPHQIFSSPFFGGTFIHIKAVRKYSRFFWGGGEDIYSHQRRSKIFSIFGGETHLFTSKLFLIFGQKWLKFFRVSRDFRFLRQTCHAIPGWDCVEVAGIAWNGFCFWLSGLHGFKIKPCNPLYFFELCRFL